MLLDLYLSECCGRAISLSSLCGASHVPPTTALRCINAMVSKSLVERRPDPDDGRRIHVALTPDAKASLEAVLDMIAHAIWN